MDENTIARFWSKVRKTEGCWLWTASDDGHGYGGFRVNRKTLKAPRVAFFIANGHWPEPCVLHSCDQPRCVNPKHLSAGTQLQNSRDRESRRRGNHATGAAVGVFTKPDSVEVGAAKRRGGKRGKLRGEDIHLVRAACLTNSHLAVGIMFGVSGSTIRSVMTGRTWSHVR
jgi:hypothetical protein